MAAASASKHLVKYKRAGGAVEVTVATTALGPPTNHKAAYERKAADALYSHV